MLRFHLPKGLANLVQNSLNMTLKVNYKKILWETNLDIGMDIFWANRQTSVKKAWKVEYCHSGRVM